MPDRLKTSDQPPGITLNHSFRSLGELFNRIAVSWACGANSYQDKVILDRKTGNGFRDYLQLPLYGQKRFGSQWLWYAPMEDYNDYANSHNQR